MGWRSKPCFGRQSSQKRGADCPYDASLPEPLLWRLAAAFAKVACVVVVAVVLLLLASHYRHLKDVLGALVPDAAMRNMLPEDAAERVDRAKKKLGTELGRQQAPSRRTFGLGSTQADVLAIQGAPDRKTDSTWWYGESEVYFAGGLVVGCKAAPGSPLRMR